MAFGDHKRPEAAVSQKAGLREYWRVGSHLSKSLYQAFVHPLTPFEVKRVFYELIISQKCFDALEILIGLRDCAVPPLAD